MHVTIKYNCKCVSYGDFAVWIKDDTVVDLVFKDDHFIETKLEDVKHIFIYRILPEIVGKWYSRKPIKTLMV